MSHARRMQRKQTCPSCQAPINVHGERGSFRTCPRCGEWLVERGRWNRRLERVDAEEGTDFDETNEWERTLAERMD